MNKLLYWFITRTVGGKLLVVLSLGLLIFICLSCPIMFASNHRLTAQQATQTTEAGATVSVQVVVRLTRTAQARPTNTLTPSPTFTPTPMPTPTPTATPGASMVVVVQRANLRVGPGKIYEVVSTAVQGEEFPVYARTEDGAWLQIDGAGGTWIASMLVRLSRDIAEVPIAANIPPTPTATSTPTPSPTPNATATAQAMARAATVTAVTQAHVDATATIEAYAYHPPQGTWCSHGSARGVCVGDFRYVNTIGYSRAPSNGRFIAFVVAVKNLSGSNITVSPLDVTLVMEGGGTYAYVAGTFTYWAQPLEVVTVAPGDYTQGGIVFLVPNNVGPSRVIYRGGLFESDIVVKLKRPPDNVDD